MMFEILVIVLCIILFISAVVHYRTDNRLIILLLNTFNLLLLLFISIHLIINSSSGHVKIINKLVDSTMLMQEGRDSNTTIPITTKCLQSTISDYINQYNHTSELSSNEITKMIIKSSNNNNLNPFILTAVLDNESRFKIDAKHSTVKVSVPTDNGNKRQTTAAIGMSGVIYEIWKNKLAEYGINNKDDLLLPSINIESSAIILSYMTTLSRIGNYNKTESALLRYYGIVMNSNGTYNTAYLDRINRVKGKLAKSYNQCIVDN